MLDQLAESMAYLMAAHTSLVDSQTAAEGRLEDSFAAANELFIELNCELTLLAQRAGVEREH